MEAPEIPEFPQFVHETVTRWSDDDSQGVLNNAVYLTEDFLKQASPPFQGEVDYGDRDEHCWNGDHSQPNAISRLRYHRMYIPKFVQRLKAHPPQGEQRQAWDQWMEQNK